MLVLVPLLLILLVLLVQLVPTLVLVLISILVIELSALVFVLPSPLASHGKIVVLLEDASQAPSMFWIGSSSFHVPLTHT